MFHSHLSLFNSPPVAPCDDGPAVQSRTPHLWVKSCPIDVGFTEMTGGTLSLDLRTQPGRSVYLGGLI
jgi:hypothetical protein